MLGIRLMGAYALITLSEKYDKGGSAVRTPKNDSVIYYRDPLRDEFSGIRREPFTVDRRFPFLREGRLYRFLKFIVYRVAVTPVAFLYCRMKFRLRIVGREKLKGQRGYFLYGNHTQAPADGFLSAVVPFPTETHVLVNSDNVALPGTRTLMQMLGALPIPTARDGFPTFEAAVRHHIEKGRCVVVFPEAHIWPYATVIRPFTAVSCRYPVALSTPSFTFTVTYRASKRGKPRMVVFVDGPFFGEGDTRKEQQQSLREKLLAAMKSRAETPENHAFIRYEREETT